MKFQVNSIPKEGDSPTPKPNESDSDSESQTSIELPPELQYQLGYEKNTVKLPDLERLQQTSVKGHTLHHLQRDESWQKIGQCDLPDVPLWFEYEVGEYLPSMVLDTNLLVESRLAVP